MKTKTIVIKHRPEPGSVTPERVEAVRRAFISAVQKKPCPESGHRITAAGFPFPETQAVVTSETCDLTLCDLIEIFRAIVEDVESLGLTMEREQENGYTVYAFRPPAGENAGWPEANAG